MRMNKSRKMRWVGYVTCMGGKKNAYKVLIGKPYYSMEDLSIGGSIILKLILRRIG